MIELNETKRPFFEEINIIDKHPYREIMEKKYRKHK